MKISPRNFKYAFRYVKQHFIREKFLNLSTLGVLSAITILANIFFVLYFFAISTLEGIYSRMDLLLYLDPASKESLRLEMYTKLEKEDFIEEISYVSGKDSLQKLLEFEEKTPLNTLDSWIELPPYLQVKTKELSGQKTLLDWMQKNGYKALLHKEQNLKENEILAQKLAKVQDIFSKLSSFIFAVLMICATGIMSLSLYNKLQSRQKEYHIMKLVGANEALQKLPIFLEASLLQSLQWLTASVMSFALAGLSQKALGLSIPFSFWGGLFLGEWLFFISLGLVSAFIALKMMEYDRK